MLFCGGIGQASAIIREGGLVVFPTETVYGLGADAFNSDAVARIYSIKGRPGDNPLILHVAKAEDFKKIAHNPPEYVFALIDAFWPGPLALVVRKNADLPGWVGGHPSGKAETIGIRMPSHSLALALIEESGCVIAAPSANKAGRPSPTSLSHVAEDFPPAEHDLFFLDGGNAEVGLESTVLDITGESPVILRPGAITEEQIHAVVKHYENNLPREEGERSELPSLEAGERGELLSMSGFAEPRSALSPQAAPAEHRRSVANESNSSRSPAASESNSPRSPGMKYKHYAPKAEMTLVSGEAEKIAEFILSEQKKRQKNSPNMGEESIIGVLAGKKTLEYFQNCSPGIKILTSGDNEEEIAKNLYSRLRQFDALEVSAIYAEAPNLGGLGVAITDRMQKASEGRIVYV